MDKIEKEIEKIRSMINESKKPLFFFDTDTDGSCSYIQLRNAFPQIKDGFPVSKDDDSQARAVNRIEYDYDLIICFDTPYLSKEFFKRTKDMKVLIVDHHNIVMQDKLDEYKNVYFFNPLRFNSGDERCSSYWAYRVSGREDNLFYAAMASVADFYILDVLKELYEYNPSQFNLLFRISEKKRKELFKFIDEVSYDDRSKQEERATWVKYLSYECDFIVLKYFFDTC